MINSQVPYGFPAPGQPLAPGYPNQYLPGQPVVPGQPLFNSQIYPGQQGIYPYGLYNPITGIVAIVAFAASVAINIYSGFWGAGFFGAEACPSTRTAQAIIIAVYVVFGLALLYSVYSRTWPEQAYYWATAASVLNTLAVVMKAWWRHSDSWLLRGLGSHWMHLLVLILLFVALYNLWWLIFTPLSFDWMSAFSRNAVAFYMGWALFSAVKAFWFAIGHLLHWKGHGNRVIFWVLQLLAFGSVVAIVYRPLYTNGVQALSGFILLALWVFIACLLHA